MLLSPKILSHIFKRSILTTNNYFKAITVTTTENQCLLVKENIKLSKTMKFPGVWLRDNCPCDDCFHKSSKSRKINWKNFDPHVKICNVSTNDDKKIITINWSDNHNSSYQLDWLKERDFSEENRMKYLTEIYRPAPIFWNKAKFNEILTEYDYAEIMNNDKVLQSWLHNLAVHGVSIIKKSPRNKEIVRKLSDRVGFIRKTTYGEEFIVESKPGAKNYAYLSLYLPLHTDLPYYEYKPGVNLLHCLEQSKSTGGSNILADGFYAANKLKEINSDYFDILVNTPVDWNDIGEDGDQKFHNIWISPVICVDRDGNYTRINQSIPQRDSHFTIKLDSVQPWYEAYSVFHQILQDETITLKTSPGDILTFNNIRLVHGRTAYNDENDNVRCIIGAYLDWDIIYSKLRVLNRKVV